MVRPFSLREIKNKKYPARGYFLFFASWWAEMDSNHRRLSRQIYSLLRLTTPPSTRLELIFKFPQKSEEILCFFDKKSTILYSLPCSIFHRSSRYSFVPLNSIIIRDFFSSDMSLLSLEYSKFNMSLHSFINSGMYFGEDMSNGYSMSISIVIYLTIKKS